MKLADAIYIAQSTAAEESMNFMFGSACLGLIVLVGFYLVYGKR